MSIKLSDLLQDIITNKVDTKSASSMLDEETKKMLVGWYLQYSDNKKADIQIVLDLLGFLYYKQDIDMTDPSVYLKTIDYLPEEYYINRETFFSMLSDFRKMVYYTKNV